MMRRLLHAALAALLLAVTCARTAEAQVGRATVRGVVTMADGSPVPGIAVTLQALDDASIGAATTDASGSFAIVDVAPGPYLVKAEGAGLEAIALIDVAAGESSRLALQLRLQLAGFDVVEYGELPLDRSRWNTSGDSLRALPAPLQSRALTRALAASPGWAEEDNGLLHVRGVDDGVLFVEDGVPVYDRLDVAFGVPPSLAGIGTMRVTTGHTPPQFGLKSGAVVELYSPPVPARWAGSADAGAGSNALAATSAAAGGPAGGPIDIFTAIAAERSSRFLDPVHPDSFHNTGGVTGVTVRGRAGIGGGGQLVVRGQTGRSRFDVPHGEAPEAAGQDQRQRVSQHSVSAAAQRSVGAAWWADGAIYARRVDAMLSPSLADTPVTTASSRRHDRVGVIGSLNVNPGAHHIVVGAEASRVALREDFRFAVTAPDADDLSDAARAFTPASPFVFAGRVSRQQLSAFAQDRLWGGPWMFDLGLRFDQTNLLVAASQWSPRLAASYDAWRLNATLRASFNRFFQPPQAEHLLLSSSEEARALSPFVDDDDGDGGGAELRPERQTAWELGWEQRLGRVTLDIAGWRRRVENYTDPNVFFGTTIVFPNSVAKGTARGLDVRLQMPSVRGVTATAAYTLSKVEQEGPINGGLFLEDDIDEIGPGVDFTPDHDQRHTASATVTWVQPVGRWAATAQARYASGTPVELGDLDDDELEELAERPGAELVDFDRGRVKPRLVVDLSASLRVRRTSWGEIGLAASVLNTFNRAYAFNFGNPFSGTHFGAPRQIRADLRVRIN